MAKDTRLHFTLYEPGKGHPDFDACHREALALAESERAAFFTDQRWEEFKRDWVAMGPRAKKGSWRIALQDRGFNPPPFWNALPGFVAKYVMVEDT